MTTENNDYMNWLQEHTTKEDNHFKNLKLKEKTAIKDYKNSMKVRTDYPLKEYQKPLAEVLDLRRYTLEELKNHNYSTKIDNNYYVRAA